MSHTHAIKHKHTCLICLLFYSQHWFSQANQRETLRRLHKRNSRGWWANMIQYYHRKVQINIFSVVFVIAKPQIAF